MRNITILNHSLIPINIYKKAEELCKNIDVDDTVFVALNDFLESILWTGDMILINGLKKRRYQNIIKTDELYSNFLERVKPT